MRNLFTIKILLIHFLFLAVPLILNSFFLFHDFYTSIIERAELELEEISILRASALRELEPESLMMLNTLSYFIEKGAGEKDSNIEQKIVHLGTIQPLREYMFFRRDDQGYRAEFASEKENVGRYARTLFPVEKLERDKNLAFFSYKMIDGKKDSYFPFLITAKGVSFSEQGVPLTILVQEAKIYERLAEILSDEKVADVRYAILNGEGVVMAATKPSFVGNYLFALSESTLSDISKEGVLGPYKMASGPLSTSKIDNRGFFEFIDHGKAFIAHITHIPELDFSMLAYLPKNVLFNKAMRHFFVIYIIFGCVIVLGGFLAFSLALWIAKPLRQLSFIMGKVSNGDYTKTFKAQALGFEINILGEVFNEVLSSLQENIRTEKEQILTKEVFRAEIDLCREVQQNLLTVEQPKSQGIISSSIFIPGKEVGGSFHLFEKKYLKDGRERLFYVFADPQSVGISSVLFSLTLRSLLRGFATVTDRLDDLVLKVNEEFLKKTVGNPIQICAWLALIHPETRRIEYLNCGMPEPWVIDKKGARRLGGKCFPPFGSQILQSCSQDTLDLMEGDRLFVYNESVYDVVSADHLMEFQVETYSSEFSTAIKSTIEKLEGSLKNTLEKEVMGFGIQL